MSKKLTGKRWFEAQGRRAFSRGRMPFINPMLPQWARDAWWHGWMVQPQREFVPSSMRETSGNG